MTTTIIIRALVYVPMSIVEGMFNCGGFLFANKGILKSPPSVATVIKSEISPSESGWKYMSVRTFIPAATAPATLPVIFIIVGYGYSRLLFIWLTLPHSIYYFL